ncbi:hypothetical protein SCMU_21050 [Sinomonas cyclohexanicum]|uniref:Type II CBASS E2 protein domain-containing protein n=1 Tax=Sinomonas cyclohexanicum TaxID=322009 RepID=A0ABN6FHQ5_SINCY|nr:hypothetical protein [Corynebacterium cyclohexanicum]BCT76263.1 hypothetical protein SCMU_21050 [Corynebacterium cyclohexanicum]
MSIAALLSHHGVKAPRYVTIDGEIVFDGVTETASGPKHHSRGPVTRVPNHTFHGGDNLTDDAGDGTPWWSDPKKLEKHVQAVELAFPNFRYTAPQGEISPSWTGEINTGRGRFMIQVSLRRDRGLPRVQLVSHQKLGRATGRRFERSPHLYLNGDLCVAETADWRRDEHTAATAIAWAAHWLACYTEWRFTMRWPVAGVNVAS